MKRAAIAALAIVVAVGAAALALRQPQSEVLTPIVAHLFADPDAFAGKTVSIYGMIVESEARGETFILQDVSQRPLRIVGSPSLTAKVGDQLTVIGTFRVERGSAFVAAQSLIPTRVLGGGGCC
jgi:hypothetical protein